MDTPRWETRSSIGVGAPAAVATSAAASLLRLWVSDVLSPARVLGITWGEVGSTLDVHIGRDKNAEPTLPPPAPLSVGVVLTDEFPSAFDARVDGRRRSYRLAVRTKPPLTVTSTVVTMTVVGDEASSYVEIVHEGWRRSDNDFSNVVAWDRLLARVPEFAAKIESEADG